MGNNDRALQTTTRADIERQQLIDSGWGDAQGQLVARMAATLQAQRALTAGEVGARSSLRQALIDLASVAELLADDLSA